MEVLTLPKAERCRRTATTPTPLPAKPPMCPSVHTGGMKTQGARSSFSCLLREGFWQAIPAARGEPRHKERLSVQSRVVAEAVQPRRTPLQTQRRA